MNTILRPALVLFVALSLLCGVVYPLVVTGLGQALFPAQAAGSLIVKDGRTVGSTLIGQNFTDPKHFWGRPSATGPMPYNASASGGSNQGPLNPALAEAVKARIAALREADPGQAQAVPIDLVTASASGLDPHISVAAARFQAPRVARLRGLPLAQVEALIEQHTEGRVLGFLGEPRVAVLPLNLALDAARPLKRRADTGDRMSEGSLGSILMSLACVVLPLLLAWLVIARQARRGARRRHRDGP